MSNQYHNRPTGQQRDPKPTVPTADWSKIQLDNPPIDLFDTIAEQAAKIVAADKHKNKPSQLRGFYDEIINWDQRSRQWTPEDFQEHLPLIKMLNAKVAYAKGRKLVDENYFSLIRHGLSQIKEKKHLHNFKLFLEAFHGFYGLYKKEGSQEA
jgi:CRISPR-associated protein Csm2